MRTDELIQQLSAEVRPVRRLWPISVRLAGWSVLALASLIAVSMIMGVRRDLAEVAETPGFAFEAALLILTALSAAVGALVVSVPGAERSALVRWTPVIAATGCVAWIVGALVMAFAAGGPTGRLTFAWHCVFKTSSIAAVPGLALFVMMRRAAPLRAAWAGLLALLATSAVGVLGANVICPNDRPLHLLLWHVAPMMVLAAAGAGLGTWLLHWTPTDQSTSRSENSAS